MARIRWSGWHTDRRLSNSENVRRILLLAIAYAIAGTLGQLLAIPPGNVTAVWPPSGIAVAALLLWGRQVWPGVWIGSILANVWIALSRDLALSPFVSGAVIVAIATGSTLQALFGRWLITNLAGGSDFLKHPTGVSVFAFSAALFCLTAATVGATSMSIGGLVPAGGLLLAWKTWWLGDWAGVLVITPLLLAWQPPVTLPARPARWVEAAVLYVLLIAAGEILFGPRFSDGMSGAPTAYLVFPLLTWAAIRFGIQGATMAVFIEVAAAAIGAARGAEQLQQISLQETIWILQLFGAVLAISTLALAAVVTQHGEVAESLRDCNRTLAERVADRTTKLTRRAAQLASSEASARNTANTLRLVLDNILEGVVVADRTGHFVLWNRAAERLVGFKGVTEFDLEPRDWPSLFGCFLPDRETPYPPDRLPLARAIRGETIREDEMYLKNDVRPNGIWLRMSAVPLRQQDGSTAGGVVVFRDVTERRLMEDQLRPVIECVLTGIVLIDRAGRIAMVNRQTEEIFGQRREDVCGQPVSLLIPEEAVRQREPRVAAQTSQEGRPPTFVSARRKNGSEFPAEIAVRSYELYGETFTVATIRDLSEHVRLRRTVETSLLIQAALNRVLGSALESSGIERYLQNALDILLTPPMFGASAAGGIFTTGDTGGEMRAIAQHGLPPELMPSARSATDRRCVCGHRLQHRGIVSIADPRRSEQSGVIPVGYCVPICDARSGDVPDFGVIYLVPSTPRPLTPDEERALLSSVACILAVAIERQRIEEALVRSERRLSLVLDATNEGIWDWNLTTGEVYFSPHWIKSLGYSPEDVPPHVSFWESLIHPDDLDRVHQALDAHLQGQTPCYECENRLRMKSGEWRWNLDRGKVVERDEQGRPLRMVGSDTDTTDRKLAETSLRESEERFDLAVRGTDAGIWDWDLRTNRIYFSPRWKSMLGYTDAEVGDDFSEWKSRLHPEDQARALETINRYIEGRSDEYELEHRLRHKDGTYRWILARGAALRDSDGHPYRMVGSHIDISAQKRTSEQLGEKLVQLSAARKIQQSLLPANAPHIPGIEVAGISQPAAFAGGDMYDFLSLIGNNFGIAVGDVCGHGVAAALQMASVHSYLRALAQTCATVGEIVSRLNSFIAAETSEGFATLILLRIDPRSRSFVYANAGHPSGYVLDRAGNVRHVLKSGTVPLGITETLFVPVTEPVNLNVGDTILLLTDGVLEATSRTSGLFGSDRAIDVLRETRNSSPADILDALRLAVLDHLDGSELQDDLTAVVAKVVD